MRFLSWSEVGTALLASLAVLGAPTDAAACGGCFNPLFGSPAPVNAHRMAISISPTQTTLWDQIEYEGEPEDFVWVLPVSGTPTIELADNAFFDSLTNTTQITMQGPFPPRMFCGGGGSSFGCGAAGGAPIAFGDAGMSRVTVHFEGVVGPYETVTIGSEDPMALIEWLQEHEYAVDDAILPTITYYTERDANFVVMRLAPQAGVDRMQPVRVTSPGLSLTFPLRMVAAGVELTVDLELFVFAEGRMEAANFGNAEVDRTAITYDWATSSFDYEDRFDDAVFVGEGVRSNWVTEFAGFAPVSQLTSWISVSDDGEVHAAQPDMEVAFAGIPSPYLTRLRTRLPPSELDRDLVLRASEGEDLGTFFTVSNEVNRPADVNCGSGCAVTQGREARGAWLAAMLGILPLALLLRRRSR